MTTPEAPPPSGQTSGKGVDSTLQKGLLILETLAGIAGGLGVTELAQRLGLTKSNTFRLLQSLTALGYVRQTGDKNYAATTKVWKVGLRVMDQIEVRTFAAPEMRRLSELFGETIYLAILEDTTLLYIDKIDSIQPVRTWTPKGGTVPVHSVGTGKALLAFNYEALRRRVIGALTRHTDKTITTAEALDREMAKVRKDGVAIDWGEYRSQVYSIGAPIFGLDGTAIAAIGISAPAANCTKADVKKMALEVSQSATAISEDMAQI